MLGPSTDGFPLYPEPRRARPTLPHPAFPVTSAAVPSSPNLCVLCVSALSSPDPCLFNLKLPALFTLRNVGSVVKESTACPVHPEERRNQSRRVNHGPNSFTIRTSPKRACNPCGLRSFKTQDLKPFRMCSSEKNGRGEGTPWHRLQSVLSLCFPHGSAQHAGIRTILFRSRVYFITCGHPGWGCICQFSLRRLHALCVSALSFSFSLCRSRLLAPICSAHPMR